MEIEDVIALIQAKRQQAMQMRQQAIVNLRQMQDMGRKTKRLRLLAVRSWLPAKMFTRMLCMSNSYYRTRRRRIWSKVENSQFWEKDLPKFNDEKFKTYLRVDRPKFELLVSRLRRLSKQDTTWRSAISLRKRIPIALYALGSSGEYRTVGSLFGVGRTTVGQIVLAFVKVMWDIFQPEFLNVYPPTQDKAKEIVAGFEIMGFPQCFGAIDGCHIRVNPPKDEATDYYNFKGWHSLILFASVDYRYRFTYFNVGTPGRSNDSTIFENSLLKQQHIANPIFSENSRVIEGIRVPKLLISDSAFRLSERITKPFPFHIEQSEDGKRFNFSLSKCRRVVENAFGHLKARFRRLEKGLQVHIDNATREMIVLTRTGYLN